jgi:leucyl aminopeptidase
MKIAFANATLPKSGVIVVFTTEGGKLTGPAATVDKSSKGQLSRAIKAANFDGKRDQFLDVIACGAYDRVIVAGLGKADSITAHETEMLGGAIAAHCNRQKPPPRP